MKFFKIGVWEEQSGYILIKANNKEEAEEKAIEYIVENGMGEEVNIKNRKIETV